MIKDKGSKGRMNMSNKQMNKQMSAEAYKEKQAALREARKSRDFSAVVRLSNELKNIDIPAELTETIDDIRAQLDDAKRHGNFSEVVRLSNILRQKVAEQVPEDDNESEPNQ